MEQGDLLPLLHLTSHQFPEFPSLLAELTTASSVILHFVPQPSPSWNEFSSTVFHLPPDCSSKKAAVKTPCSPSIQYPLTSYSASQTCIKMQILVQWVLGGGKNLFPASSQVHTTHCTLSSKDLAHRLAGWTRTAPGT